MTTTVNPTTMTIGDVDAATNGVTAFKVLLGTTSGGPYAGPTATVPVADMTVSGSSYAVAMSKIAWSPALVPGTIYYGVCQEENAGGVSGNSPEASFQVVPAATPPQSLSFT